MRESEREREIDRQHRSVGNHFLGQLSNLFADLPESIDQPECCHLLWTPLQNSMKSYSKKSTRLRSNSTANVMHKSRSCCISSSSSGGAHGIFIGQGETPQEHWIRQSWGFSLMRLFDLFKAIRTFPPRGYLLFPRLVQWIPYQWQTYTHTLRVRHTHT